MLVLAEWWFVKPGHRSAFRMTISANSSINHRSGKVWWQRLKECKRHRWASDYCNCHQIPTRTLALSSPASLTHQHSRHQPRPEWHRCFAHTRTHIHTLSTCPLTRLWIIFLSVFFNPLSDQLCFTWPQWTLLLKLPYAVKLPLNIMFIHLLAGHLASQNLFPNHKLYERHHSNML